MKKYTTPDFDVTVYEIKETIASIDGDEMTSITGWEGELNPAE
jgi:hypothetical protein